MGRHADVAPEETMATIAMAVSYEETGELLWTISRANRLARMCHCTIHELIYRCGETNFRTMNRYLTSKALNPFPGPLCRWLYHFEREIIDLVLTKGKVV